MRKDKQRPILVHSMHWGLVQDLGKIKDPKTKISIFTRLMDAVAFAACLGFELQEKYPLPDGDKEDIGWPQVETERDDSLINLMAIAEKKTLNVLEENSEDDPVRIFEEYVHGGLSKISIWRKEQPIDDVFDAIIEGLVKHKILNREEEEGKEITFDDN